MEARKRSVIRHLKLHPERNLLAEIQYDLKIDAFDLLCCLHELGAEGFVRETKNLTSLGLNSPNGARFSLVNKSIRL